jgi:hypothetical protein
VRQCRRLAAILRLIRETKMETNEQRKQRILNRQSEQTQIVRYSTVLNMQAPGTVANTEQTKLLNEATDIEKGLRMLIEGIEYYCKGTSATWDAPIGKDYVLAPAVGLIINGIIGLLNGPGHFDGGTCDGALRAIAKKYEIDDVEV